MRAVFLRTNLEKHHARRASGAEPDLDVEHVHTDDEQHLHHDDVALDVIADSLA